jgi:hypothetical protein
MSPAQSALAQQWRRDPFCHPSIRHMSAREKFDLPIEPARILPD